MDPILHRLGRWTGWRRRNEFKDEELQDSEGGGSSQEKVKPSGARNAQTVTGSGSSLPICFSPIRETLSSGLKGFVVCQSAPGESFTCKFESTSGTGSLLNSIRFFHPARAVTSKMNEFGSPVLKVRLVYVRVKSHSTGETPEYLTLKFLKWDVEKRYSLQVDGGRIAASQETSLHLRRVPRVDAYAASKEVMYLSTNAIHASGAIKFEVHVNKNLLLRGSLNQSEGGSPWWSMDCISSISSQPCPFLQDSVNPNKPCRMEVCMVGHYRKSPVMLNKIIPLIVRRTARKSGSPMSVITEAETSGSQTGNNDGVSSDMLGQLNTSEDDETRSTLSFLRANIPAVGGAIMLGVVGGYMGARFRHWTRGLLI